MITKRQQTQLQYRPTEEFPKLLGCPRTLVAPRPQVQRRRASCQGGKFEPSPAL